MDQHGRRQASDIPAERIGLLSARTWAYCVAIIFAAAIAYDLLRHHIAGSFAFRIRNDWASQPGALKRAGLWPADPEQQRVILQLQGDALASRVPNPRFQPLWANEIWGD